jgi:hypothetical protein
MSGQGSYKGSLTNFLQRRAFLLRVGLVTGGIFLNGCIQKAKPRKYQIKGKINGPNAAAGHILRDKTPLPAPSKTVKLKTLIVGAGISGLSAGRWLQKNGETDFQILELEDHTGGNAHSGKNEVSAYPLGAHYITIANNDDNLLLDFLQEIGVITHLENGIPFYNEFYLTFDPEERLLINGEWQEGLIPDFGVPTADKKQIKDFLTEVGRLKNTKGSDGKFAFNIPISESSNDEVFKQLDHITFKQYLNERNYHSKYLLWYLNYACKDDYGQPLDKISAWAGLHYFASRRGKAVNAEENAILTWPQGNGWLVQQMIRQLESHLTKSTICHSLTTGENGSLNVLIYDLKTKQSIHYEVEKVILCTPQFVNQRLLKQLKRPLVAYDAFTYSPWLIANITLNELPAAKGVSMCWDNVAFGTPSVGYVNASHQDLKQTNAQRVLTFYLPLCDFEPRVARLAAYARTYEQWLDIVMPELDYMHPGIEQAIAKIDFWVWGHGMIAPTPNLIFGKQSKAVKIPINNQVFFAHTDLSGISIFEEAFHQGIQAAKAVLNG